MTHFPRVLLQGVSWCRIMKKWRAQFGYGGKCRNLGYFDDPADAVSIICAKVSGEVDVVSTCPVICCCHEGGVLPAL